MKIALLGSAPSSRMLAPFKDPEWEIWACSPGNMDLPRFDIFFEIHGIDTEMRLPQYSAVIPPNKESYIDFCRRLPKIYMQDQRQEYPGSIKYPFDEMNEKFGRFFWTSSLSYMLALAIDRKPDAIGLWGVDMAASEEYGYQRAGCHYFIQKAEEAGIDIVVPFESDIMRPHPPYGFREASQMWWKQNTRWKELHQQHIGLNDEIVQLQKMIEAKKERASILSGAMEQAQYNCNTYL